MTIDLASFWNDHPLGRLGITLAVALAIAFVVRRVAYATLRRLARRHPAVYGMVSRASAPMEWLVPLLTVAVALRITPDVDSLRGIGGLHQLLLVALIATVTWLVVRCIGALEDLTIRLHPIDLSDNLRARSVVTQVRVLSRSAMVLAVLAGLAAVLMTIPGVRQFGASLLASAGLAGLALGIAAKPVLSNLIAGLQIALAQPIRLDDVVIVQGEWGRIEEITGTYVVVRIWDERRLIVPLNYFIENPFENWTRRTARLIGTVFLWVDYRLPMAPLRMELERLCREAPEWDGRVCVLQVTDASEHAMQLRALVSSADSSRGWDLRCRIREGLIAFVQREYPDYLPTTRIRWDGARDGPAAPAPESGTGTA
ncbi:mechanosensitive ion channel [Dyella sp. BiH032]|uniref:mechanosensitive ion channel family protein n=1 Tax=Dyella sp. BiH032 TaxID=3075430 RepID=UPI002892C9AF|nr:mechanosensitive ion channel domain-containing protein [Dyella sp. BiH032]WNL47376.1 mechanosensitive ion channel [Dyella sp. BiH032]